MTNLDLYMNYTGYDVARDSVPSGEEYYIELESIDYLIFTAGSDDVQEGEDLPSTEELNRAGTLLSDVDPTVVAHYLLADVSEDLLREAHLAGRANNRYVFCAAFDGATASEPVLEAWDDENRDSYESICLGAGVPASSWYKAVCTTNASPGLNWTGTPLAGDGSSNVVLLNGGAGALSGAKDLYFNFHEYIPAGISTPGVDNPVLAISYTTN
jgi:hypothetical protein